MKKRKISALVSVIIPAFNASKYVGEAIDSIVNQTYKNLEIIVINDASTDDTLAIAKRYAKSDKRITVYDNEKNMGIGKNRAKGIKLAKGKYICWQDADDISLPDRILHQVEYLEGHKDVGVVGGYIHFFDESCDMAVRRYAEHDVELRKSIFKYNPVAQPASTVRAEVYNAIGTYSAKYTVSEDIEMLFRIGTKYKFANIQEEVLRYRQSAGSLTRMNLRKMEKAVIALRMQYSKHPAYNFTLADRLYNIAQYVSMALPVNIRMFIFKIIRGDK